MPEYSEQSMRAVIQAANSINREVGNLADLVKVYTQYTGFKPNGPKPIGMHGTPLDEFASVLHAIRLNLSTLNKMFTEVLPRLLGTV